VDKNEGRPPGAIAYCSKCDRVFVLVGDGQQPQDAEDCTHDLQSYSFEQLRQYAARKRWGWPGARLFPTSA
jgi:hypothetical protein